MRVLSPGELRHRYPAPADLIRRKQLSRLDHHCRRIIELSPLVCLATADADGACDVSPRGDAPGFVRILDDRRLAIPDRTGNNRLDSLRNIAENRHVGLLFLVPGVDDTLRVNGRAEVVADEGLLAGMAVGGRLPLSAIVVRVEEAYLHCGRALKRARLWDPTTFAPRGTLPPLGQMLADQTRPDDAERELLAKSEQTELY